MSDLVMFHGRHAMEPAQYIFSREGQWVYQSAPTIADVVAVGRIVVETPHFFELELNTRRLNRREYVAPEAGALSVRVRVRRDMVFAHLPDPYVDAAP